MLSIVLGAKPHKMPFGHHGANHPVRDLVTGKVEITSQNHSFAVEAASLPDHLELTHINLNDNTVKACVTRKSQSSASNMTPKPLPGP